MPTILSLFTERTREVGDDLFFDGAVTIPDSGRGQVKVIAARVDDGDVYEVVIRRSGQNVALQCSCPGITPHEGCEHIWATLLEANSTPRLRRWLAESFAPPFLMKLDESLGGAPEPKRKDSAPAARRGKSGTVSRSGPRAGSARAHSSARAGRSIPPPRRPSPPPSPPLAPPRWKTRLRAVEMEMGRYHAAGRKTPDPASTRPLQVSFFVTPSTRPELPVEVEVLGARMNQNGQWGKRRSMVISYDDLETIESQEDAAALRRLLGVQDWRIPESGGGRTRLLLRPDLFAELGRAWAARGRLLGPEVSNAAEQIRRRAASPWSPTPGADPAQAIPLTWDEGGAWRLEIALRDNLNGNDPDGDHLQASLRLVRGDEHLSLAAAELFLHGFALFGDHLVEVEGEELRPWARTFDLPLEIPKKDADEFLAASVLLPGCPVFDAPKELQWSEIPDPPIPHLHILGPDEVPEPFHGPLPGPIYDWNTATVGRRELAARLEFDYGGILIDERRPETRVVDKDRRAVVVRHHFSEATALRTLTDIGVKKRQSGRGHFFVLNESKVPDIVASLIDRGWRVWAKDAVIRKPQRVQTQVSSGIDWFAVHVSVSYDGEGTVDLAAILAALKKGEKTVRLGDGTIGILPEEWLRRNGLLLDVGKAVKGELRFGAHQAPLLDALLRDQPEVQVDERFEKVRQELRSFDGLRTVKPLRSFRATMRDYQQASLGWFQFLRQFGFGGCLADDMGLGKTIMALALLDSRRTVKGVPASLVVVPRSLAFNWLLEAKKFAPKVRFHDHSGVGRQSLSEVLAKKKPHVVLTTYGILRRDIEQFREVVFDYAIVDESQAIKNHHTGTSKAVRLLNARHRLALSGTPVENHVGELWSLFAFLNPGLLGSSQKFHKWATMRAPSSAAPALQGRTQPGDDSTADQPRGASAGKQLRDGSAEDPLRDTDDSVRDNPVASNLLAAAVRPFVLRRTKAQVAKELPEKEEQTVYCTLDKAQRGVYEALRSHYQSLLLGEGPAKTGTGEAKQENKALLVLQGLLRLRQAACHPGLLDPADAGARSAKLEMLIERLRELKEEGHKALVFSQFVTLLSLVRTRLGSEGIRYEYLDGKTRNRAAKVDRFQNDPDLDVFLISLKAGGTGLNLTAATYVFLLDPWWNPAVEAQAIDRTHRIGQTRSVLACRLVARDTVEERILELQERKRDLANSIILEDAGLMKNLQREDLAFLLE